MEGVCVLPSFLTIEFFYLKMFGIFVPGQPVRTDIVQTSPTTFTLDLSTGGNHLAIFLSAPLNNPSLVAGIYLLSSGSSNWTYLGFVSDVKPSAIFKINNISSFQLGISIEPPKNTDNQLILKNPSTDASAPSSIATSVLRHLYHYVMSFNSGGVDSTIPVSLFTDWYTALSKKLSIDPNYLATTQLQSNEK